MKGLSVSIIFIAIAVILSLYLGYSMGTSGFSVNLPTAKTVEKVTPTTTTTQTETTTTATTETTITTTETVQATVEKCPTDLTAARELCNDNDSCTIDDCTDTNTGYKCEHTSIPNCVATASVETTTTTTTQTTETTTTTTQAPQVNAANHLLITEFSTRGNTASDEFVELYNPTNDDVDIAGYRIQYKSATGASWSTKAIFVGGTKIPSHKFFLVSSAQAYVSLTADYYSTTYLGLSDAGGHIRLIDENIPPNEIDRVGWGTANDPEGGTGNVAPAQENLATGSVERQIYWQDTDDNANDFQVKDTREPQNLASAALVPS